MEQLIESVRDGTLDFTLTKPEDAQLLVSIQRVEIWKLTDIVPGRRRAGRRARRGWATHVGRCAGRWRSPPRSLAGGVIVYSFWLILATLAFWFVRVENILVIFQSMYEAGRWPVSLYPGWLRFALTFIVPVAFAVTVPAAGAGRPADLEDARRRLPPGRRADRHFEGLLARGRAALLKRLVVIPGTLTLVHRFARILGSFRLRPPRHHAATKLLELGSQRHEAVGRDGDIALERLAGLLARIAEEHRSGLVAAPPQLRPLGLIGGAEEPDDQRLAVVAGLERGHEHVRRLDLERGVPEGAAPPAATASSGWLKPVAKREASAVIESLDAAAGRSGTRVGPS